ncbi:unnamed protein product [Cuscuta europaea]|uniref:Uncharacterized protein n=1 Tax=Cuscuta europaea TaxID=41803 RepID=A0A9P1EII7_CUSEU|nr:unnamed protein product [Cuscuta europaea]
MYFSLWIQNGDYGFTQGISYEETTLSEIIPSGWTLLLKKRLLMLFNAFNQEQILSEALVGIPSSPNLLASPSRSNQSSSEHICAAPYGQTGVSLLPVSCSVIAVNCFSPSLRRPCSS